MEIPWIRSFQGVKFRWSRSVRDETSEVMVVMDVAPLVLLDACIYHTTTFHIFIDGLVKIGLFSESTGRRRFMRWRGGNFARGACVPISEVVPGGGIFIPGALCGICFTSQLPSSSIQGKDQPESAYTIRPCSTEPFPETTFTAQ